MNAASSRNSRSIATPLTVCSAVLLALWCVGMFGRGLFTPDEPREADLAWRMSWQADKSVPLLAGEAFCEKPPLAYWLAAPPIKAFGLHAWSARLPNLLYAMISALCVGLLARLAAGPGAALAGAAAISTFLLAYQVSIWLATDAPLLAAVSAALLGAHCGFYAADDAARLRGYLLMHAALGFGFLAKSAAAFMVPALALPVLALWERRWRELLRWELYLGLLLEAAMIFTWVWFVYAAPDGVAHLKVFFWNNLVGRFTRVDAPGELQYAAGHRNTPGKYWLELPMYLAPWTVLVAAALRRAWIVRRRLPSSVKFALAASVPPLLLLSVAATARNVYFAPALPGFALLLAWWVSETARDPDRWDLRAIRATAALMLVGALGMAAAAAVTGADAWESVKAPAAFIIIAAAGTGVAIALAVRAWRVRSSGALRAQWALFLAYAALLIGPMSQIYARANAWQDLGSIGRAIRSDAQGRPLVLIAPDETTRAIIDLYASTQATVVPGPVEPAALARLQGVLHASPHSVVVVQQPGREASGSRVARWLARRSHDSGSALPDSGGADPPWLEAAGLKVAQRYALPNGRRYLLLEPGS